MIIYFSKTIKCILKAFIYLLYIYISIIESYFLNVYLFTFIKKNFLL